MGTTTDFALLARDPQTGKLLVDQIAYAAGVAGAVVADLLIERRISWDDRGKLQLMDPRPLGDAVLHRALAAVQADPKHRSVARWVSRFERREVQDDVIGLLLRRGDVSLQEKRVLGIFPSKRYPATTGEAGRTAFEMIRVVLAGEVKADESAQALIGICDATGVLRRVAGPVDRHVLKPFRDADVARAVRSSIEQHRASSTSGANAGSTAAIIT
ncbi:Golgi phosphoprotein 3 GPP34 [Frondihabitans sp. PhB188]|uniref:GOLPH3/VPS74 family protein n=1 Tax=Frondihabitans sp. PhB188 TaxID=2485200 RepID=UPI000F460862|nr:GPP34 family phosphoprotein [Frondihabitans sp. PhB188]ROQ40786.1 Golgi phosphoprotein 3 GPP34 [Frondihabitans sp. PhB188]